MKHKARPTKSSRHKSVTFIIGSQTSFGSQQHQQRQQQSQQQQQPQQQQQQQQQQAPVVTSMVDTTSTRNATNTPIKSHKFLSQHLSQHQSQLHQLNQSRQHQHQKLSPRKTTTLTPTDIAQRNYGGSSAEALAAAAAAAIASTSSFQQNLNHIRNQNRFNNLRLQQLQQQQLRQPQRSPYQSQSISARRMIVDPTNLELPDQQVPLDDEDEDIYGDVLDEIGPEEPQYDDEDIDDEYDAEYDDEHNQDQDYQDDDNDTDNPANAVVDYNNIRHQDSTYDSILRKQGIEPSHMEDVMRLAFLENNDIQFDDCSKIDFNSLSTASILHRNIQQQLKQERRDQQCGFDTDQNIIEDYDTDCYYDDSQDSKFFAANNIIDASSHRHGDASGSNSAGSINMTANQTSSNKKQQRTRDSTPRVRISNHVQVETIQSNGDGFLCDEPGCGKSFPSLRKLRHHKVVHSDEFPFVCEFNGCGKKFKRKFGIDLHSTTHFDLDPKMYKKTSNNSSLPFFGRRMQYSMCKPCGQKFKTVHEYQYHMSKHGKEPFKCPVKGCGQTFGIWKSFQKHRASHYFNYYCKMDPQCDHHTSNLQLLKLHIYCCHYRRKLPEYSGSSNAEELE